MKRSLFHLHQLFAVCLAGNILVWNPNMGHSHVRFLGNLADMYAKDGHNVTILSPIMDESVPPHGSDNPNITKIEYRSPFIDMSFWDKFDMKKPSFWDQPEPDAISFKLEDMQLFYPMMENLYKGLLQDDKLIAQLKDSKFDLAMAEYFEYGPLGLFEILGIETVICAAALGWIIPHYDITGLPNFHSFVPSYITTFGDQMTFVERLQNMKVDYEKRRDEEYWKNRLQDTVFRKFHPELEDLFVLAERKTGIILANANEFTESPRPTTNMVQYVGGTNVHPPKPLSKEISEILDRRPASVLFSFGTFTKGCLMPLQLKLDILEAFTAFSEVTFLWKYEDSCENDTLPELLGQYPNVVAKKWWPQTDLLGDERLKAFITHAGMNSMLEVAFRGKPAITIPLFADQYANAKTSERLGKSVMIKRTELGKKRLVAALHKVLDKDSEVAQKARMAARVLEGKGDEYRKEALRWARLLIEFGPMEHHRLYSKNLNLFQLYMVDCLLFIASIPILSIVLTFSLYRLLLRLVSRKEKQL